MEREHEPERSEPAPGSGGEVGERREPGEVRRSAVPPPGPRPPAAGAAVPVGDDRARRDPWAIRAEDTEPYVALQYVARLFKIVAMVVVVALTAEIVAGVALEGVDALLPLIFDVVRGIVLAAILWGAGDLTLLLIDVGHDVRAGRILLGRLTARTAGDYVDRRDRRDDTSGELR
ncbi:MAG TPA: hypothetical protein VF263_20890 [Longimicrobiaceae bacterium]